MRLSRGRCFPDSPSGRASRALGVSSPLAGLGRSPLRLAALWCVAHGLLAPSVAGADEAERPIVVIVDSEDGTITRRLRQELEALGFSVQVRAEAPPATSAPGLGAAVAVIEIKAARPGSVQLAIVDPKTTKILRQALPIEAAYDPNASELVATRTVELLRAARLMVRAQAEPEQPKAAPTPAPAPPPSAPPALRAEPISGSRLLVGVGFGVAYSPDWTLGSDAVLGAAFLFSGRLGVVAELAVPMTPCQLVGPNGNIDAFSNRYRIGGVVEVVHESPVDLRFSGGVELEQLSFRGRADAPYVNAESHLLGWAPWLSAALGLRVVRSLRVTTGVSGAWTWPRSAVNFAGREVSHWGRPGFTAVAGAEWSFP